MPDLRKPIPVATPDPALPTFTLLATAGSSLSAHGLDNTLGFLMFFLVGPVYGLR